MEKTGMYAVCPAGRFDQSLLAVECNIQMLEFMGEFAYSSLYKLLAEKDIPRVEKALEKCRKAVGSVEEECVHLRRGESGWDTFIMSMHCGNDRKKYYIELQNLSLSERNLRKSESEKEILQDFATLTGGVYFTYRIADGLFSMFWMAYEQKIELYTMSFDSWEELVIRDGLVSGKDADIFRAFCASVRKAAGEQKYTFHGKILSGGRSQEAYRVKFIPRSHADGVMVEGVWLSINEQTGDLVDDYITGINLDPLTKLLNKKAINQYAQKSVEKGENPAIIITDIDSFKSFNDTYGHPFGDAVIAAVADVIKKAIGSHGVAGRIGGDEFMAVLTNYGDELGLRNYLRVIKTGVAAVLQELLGDNRVTCSIGVSRCGLDADNFGALYRIADRALYIAKEKGKNRYIIYKQELHGRFNTSSDELDMKEIRGSFYTEQDLDRFNECLQEVVLHGSEKIPALLEQLVRVLAVSRAVIFWGDNRRVLGCYPPDMEWADKRELFESPEYMQLFRGDMLYITNTNMLEFTLPEMYELYKENDVRSLVQHFLRGADGNICGFVTVEEKNGLGGLPKLGVQLFKSMCKVVNAVLVRENA